jgi:hypothetical protein
MHIANFTTTEETMQPISSALPAVQPDRRSQLGRLHALALSAMRDRDGLPVWRDKEIDEDLPRALYGGWTPDPAYRQLARPMTNGERAAIEARAAALELALEPFGEEDRGRVDESVSAMFSGFRSMGRQSGDQVGATIEVTMAVLAPFPAWAIAKGCLKVARNEAGLDRRFAPNDGEVADVVKEIVRPYKAALTGARGLLLAKKAQTPEALPPKREDRPTYEELQARCAASGLMIGKRKRTVVDVAKARDEFCAKYGVTPEQLDAIPDATNV